MSSRECPLRALSAAAIGVLEENHEVRSGAAARPPRRRIADDNDARKELSCGWFNKSGSNDRELWRRGRECIEIVRVSPAGRRVTIVILHRFAQRQTGPDKSGNPEGDQNAILLLHT